MTSWDRMDDDERAMLRRHEGTGRCICNGGRGPDGGLDGPDYWLVDSCPIHGDEAREGDEDEVLVAGPRFVDPPRIEGASHGLHVQLGGHEFAEVIDALEDRAFMLRRLGPSGRMRFERNLAAWKRLVIGWHGSAAAYPPYEPVILEWDDPTWEHLLEENE